LRHRHERSPVVSPRPWFPPQSNALDASYDSGALVLVGQNAVGSTVNDVVKDSSEMVSFLGQAQNGNTDRSNGNEAVLDRGGSETNNPPTELDYTEVENVLGNRLGRVLPPPQLGFLESHGGRPCLAHRGRRRAALCFACVEHYLQARPRPFHDARLYFAVQTTLKSSTCFAVL
jgi:hypothetical protein